MNPIIVYSAEKNNRLQYVLDWLFGEQLILPYTIVTDERELHDVPFFISYGKHFLNALSIPNGGLLMAQGTAEQSIETGAWYGMPTIYAINEAGYTLPFDLFSAIFFLLSRYEEYYPFTPDKHDRYPATQSLLYKNGWLQRPLLDEWVHELRVMLQKQYNIDIAIPSFSHRATYDIDIAYSYLNKGFARSAGAIAKDLLTGKVAAIRARAAVLLTRKKDPYDSFAWLQQVHRNSKPLYFILGALKTTPYDKNISPLRPEMRKLIKQLSTDGLVGIHPSYYSDTETTLAKEKKTIEKITGKEISISRQHYIKMNIPGTYRLLIDNGVAADYSMGYGTHLGFRAATGKSFFWYDIEKETTTGLRVHPFCFMDTTALYEEKLPVSKAFERLNAMTRKLQHTNSRLITVFHNFSLGKDKEWKGWRNNYEAFLEEVKQGDSPAATIF